MLSGVHAAPCQEVYRLANVFIHCYRYPDLLCNSGQCRSTDSVSSTVCVLVGPYYLSRRATSHSQFYRDPKVAKDPATTCWSPIDIQISAYVNAGISIVTDVVFSLLPIVFLRKLNRPLRERLVLGLLMALGLTATLASILKVTLLYNYRNTRDPYWDSIPLSLWWQLEQNISIIASCIPTLKSPFEKALRRTGMISTQSGTAHSSRGYVSYGGGSDHKMKNLKTIVQGGEVIQEIPDDARSEDSILRMERQAYVATPQKGINKRTDIHSSTEQLVAEMDWAAVQKKAIGQTDGHSTESWVG